MSLDVLTQVYEAQGRLAAAEPIAEKLQRCRLARQERALRKVSRKLGEISAAQNNLAWFLATSPRKEIREPKRAVELARKAVVLAPASASIWNTLGVALYRIGDLKGAIEALEKSERLAPDKHLADNGFFLAMAHWQLDQKSEARKWFDRAVKSMVKNQPENAELRRFRAEAEELLGIKAK
jgi:tetratricopeptide (TPR) repeat protein